MDAAQIISTIKRRQDEFWDKQIAPDGDPVYSEAELARAISDEYDSLLIEIGAIKPSEAKNA
jgi:hypothetical protein